MTKLTVFHPPKVATRHGSHDERALGKRFHGGYRTIANMRIRAERRAGRFGLDHRKVGHRERGITFEVGELHGGAGAVAVGVRDVAATDPLNLTGNEFINTLIGNNRANIQAPVNMGETPISLPRLAG